MKLVLEAKTEQGAKSLKEFREQAKNPMVRALAKLKVNVVSDKPYIIVCESKVFGGQGDASKVDINKIYSHLQTFWFPNLKPKKDYIAKAV